MSEIKKLNVYYLSFIALYACFLNLNAAYAVDGPLINNYSPQEYIEGYVRNEEYKPIEGVSVKIKHLKTGSKTRNDGYFTIKAKVGDTLIFSCVGYLDHQIVVKNLKTYNLTLKSDNKIEEVVINAGIITRNKNTFTGATSTFSGDQLKSISNGNLIQSLKTLDPSFIQIETSEIGSNPNSLPTIEIRGKSGISNFEPNNLLQNDPNQPLFVLNGMETTLQRIVDLDINRIESVTILKDAASTSLYGSRAANGVVVIETKRPKNGEISLNYNSDFRFELPDLLSYNMMNAAENLEFQKLAGLFTAKNQHNLMLQYDLDTIYNNRLIHVLNGADYSWINIPLRNAFTQNHNLSIEGGDGKLSYGAGVNYKIQPGVMKESYRRNFASNLDLVYRSGKFNISNQIYLSRNDSQESPYGSFRQYININPYFSPYDSDGKVNKQRYIIEESVGNNFGTYVFDQKLQNPLYNASLNSFNRGKGLAIQNNFNLLYDITPSFRISSGLNIHKEMSSLTDFTSPIHTKFDGLDILKRGSYFNQLIDVQNYQGNLMLTFNKVIAQQHIINANIRTEAQYNLSVLQGFSAIGFPDLQDFNLSFAFSYPDQGKPQNIENKYTRLNNLMSFNYSFKNRYIADFTYRIDGSTSFGSNNKYSTFLSGGIGWNLQEEKFLKNFSKLNLLRIRANLGSNGNQNLGNFPSSSVYNIIPGINPYGISYQLTNLGNPNLKWQKTLQLSYGVDLSIFDRRFNATLNGYRKNTDPLIIESSLPGSSGVSVIPLNAGMLQVSGAEIILSYSPIFNEEKGIVWNLNIQGNLIKSKYDKIESSLDYQNEKLLSASSLIRYRDGNDPDEVYAVRSLGIDPASGREIFQKRDGKTSFVYDNLDVVPLGSSNPLVQGIFGTNLRIKSFTVGISIRYSIMATKFNTPVFEKVENISTQSLYNNQDKRALDERWKMIGDNKSFRAINILDVSDTPMSSRFVQKENFISGESISVSYLLPNSDNWLQRTSKIKNLKLNAYMNDIFRFSNITLERGLDYPFSRSVSFSLSASF